MTADEYALFLRMRLPRGDAWPSADDTDGTTGFDKLLSALAQEPARIDDDAMALLEKIIPDNASTDLDAWEEVFGAPDTNLTDAERLARIKAKLRKQQEIDRGTLEAYARKMADDEGVVLLNRARYNASVDIVCAGDNVGDHSFTWLCELYPNILAAAPDDFEAWETPHGPGPWVDNNDGQSPVTLSATAAHRLHTIAYSGRLRIEMAAEDGDTARASVWVKVAGDDCTAYLSFLERDGTNGTPSEFAITGGVWHRLTHEASVGAGASVPKFQLWFDTGFADPEVHLSWAVAGVVDTALEERIAAAFPLHARGEFGVQGEWATLLEQDPKEAMN